MIPKLEILRLPAGGRSSAPMRFGRLRQAAAGFLLALSAAVAGAQTPTAEQIEMFRNLSPDQQQAILEAIGGGRTGPRTTTSTEQSFDAPQTVLPRLLGEADERDREADADPRLQTGDTLIVELELLEFEEDERVLTERPQPELTMLQGAQALPVSDDRTRADAAGRGA